MGLVIHQSHQEESGLSSPAESERKGGREIEREGERERERPLSVWHSGVASARLAFAYTDITLQLDQHLNVDCSLWPPEGNVLRGGYKKKGPREGGYTVTNMADIRSRISRFHWGGRH